MLSLDDIEQLFARHGSAQYSGEPVTQLEHALQTAHLAEQSEAGDELVTACLLHDLGHLLNEQGETPTLRGIDDTHQYFALPFLRGLFPAPVLDAIRLHVDAKRYLCRVNAGYFAKLSEDSKRSLALQGGVFEPAEAAAFIAQPGARDAVMLRQWDDLAKQADLATPSLAHFLSRAARCSLRAAAA
ncbi:MAG TPA: HD domain-containing protein [Caldimonas sp.]|jgi:phosphonate degradation associated HDIG domain protein|nr:phosphonate degradation HD-domain oxygenase [Caldimonas sp.]HEX2542625.1 HD domain-containing protein [Caldimonas sp.]